MCSYVHIFGYHFLLTYECVAPAYKMFNNGFSVISDVLARHTLRTTMQRHPSDGRQHSYTIFWHRGLKVYCSCTKVQRRGFKTSNEAFSIMACDSLMSLPTSHHKVSYSTFCEMCMLPHIMVTRPMSDLWWVCQKNRITIMRASNHPEEKSEVNILQYMYKYMHIHVHA